MESHVEGPSLFVIRSVAGIFVVLMGMVAIGCGSDDVSTDDELNVEEDGQYRVGGTVEVSNFDGGEFSEIFGESLVLRNHDDKLAVDEPGPFEFLQRLDDGAEYEVGVDEAPDGMSCEITDGTGTIEGEDVEDVIVDCDVDGEEPPVFMVEIDEEASILEVDETETIIVAVEIENVNEEPGTKAIDIAIDDEFEATEEVDLGGLDTEAVTFEWETDVGDAGEYSAEVSSPDDSDTAQVVVGESDVAAPAYFDVEIDEDASVTTVEEGETAVVEGAVENTGEESATKDVELLIDGVVEDEVELTLDGGESQSVTLDWETEAGDSGTYPAEVASEDASDTVEIVVEEPDVAAPAYFDVEIDEDASVTTVEEGETAVVEATVENTGEESATNDVELLIDGVVEDEVELTLDGGESQSVTLDWETETGDEGTYDAVVDSGDDTDETTVTVNEPGATQATLIGTVTDSASGEALADVMVLLFDEDDELVDDVDTDGDGTYEFDGIDEGDYSLGLEAPGLEPSYGIDEAGGESTLAISLSVGINEEDLTVDWMRETDFFIDGGLLDLQYDDDGEFGFAFPGCEQQADGSWEPVGGGSDDDNVEITYDPDDECFQITDVGIDIATGELDADVDDMLFPDVEIFIDDEDDEIDEELESITVEFVWLLDAVGGAVDFTDGSTDIDLDLRILIGGEIVASTDFGPIPIAFGSWIGEDDCQLTDAWGGGLDDPEEDDNDEQIGEYLHDPIDLLLTTETSGPHGLSGESYDVDQGVFVTIDNGFTIDRLSEGQFGQDDEGGASCGEVDFDDNEEDFAAALNELLGLPSDEGDLLWESDLLVP